LPKYCEIGWWLQAPWKKVKGEVHHKIPVIVESLIGERQVTPEIEVVGMYTKF
jgi:hypothetical protein